MQYALRLSSTPRRALLGAALLAAAASGGCGGEESTAGKRLTHRTRITAGAEATEGFTNALGWSITLARAQISVGALYYFDGAPVTARLTPRLLERVSRWLIPEAHAHPGHYQPGNALGEMTEATSVDLVDGSPELADSTSVNGLYRSARIDFLSPAVGPLAGELGQAVVVVEGVAEKAGESRPFRVEGAIADVVDPDGEAAVAGCVFEEADVQEGGTVTVRVLLSVWLDQIDFAEVPESADGRPVRIEPGTVPHKAFARGLKKGTAYVFSYSTGIGG